VLGADGKPIQLARFASRPGATATDAGFDLGLKAERADIERVLEAVGIDSKMGAVFLEEFDTSNDGKFSQTEWARFERAIMAYVTCKDGDNHEGLVKIVNQYFTADGFRYLSPEEMKQTSTDFLAQVGGGIKFNANGLIKVANLNAQLMTLIGKNGYTDTWINGLIADIGAAADNDGDKTTLSRDELADMCQAYWLDGKYVKELIKDNGVHTKAIASFMLKGEYKAEDKKKAEGAEDTDRTQEGKVEMPDENTKTEAEAALTEAEQLVEAGGEENFKKALEKYQEAIRLGYRFVFRAESEKQYVEGKIEDKLLTRIRGEKDIKEKLKMLAEIPEATKAPVAQNIANARADYETAYVLVIRARDGLRGLEQSARKEGRPTALSAEATRFLTMLEKGDAQNSPFLKYMDVNRGLNFDMIISSSTDGERLAQSLQLEIIEVQKFRKEAKDGVPKDGDDKAYAQRVIKSMDEIIEKIKAADFGEGIDKDMLLQFATYVKKSMEIVLAMTKNDIKAAQAIYRGETGKDIGFSEGKGLKDVAEKFGSNAEQVKKMIDDRKKKLEEGRKAQAAVDGQASSRSALFE
jgi:hypothetical protein